MKRDERIRPPSFTSLTPLYPTPLHIIHWHGNATPSLSSSALRTSTALGGVHTYNIPAPQSLVFLPPLHPYQSKELNSSPVTPIPSLAPNNNRFSAAPAGFDASNSRSPVLCDGPSKHPSDAEVRHFLGFHPGQKLDLDSLKDPPPGHRPSQIIKHLAVLAILGSPDRRLTFDGICNALERRFEWFRLRASGEEASWKRSLRHGLSLHACFKRCRKLVTEGGYGYWTIGDCSVSNAKKRLVKRSRGRKREDNAPSSLDNQERLPIALVLVGLRSATSGLPVATDSNG